MTGKKAKEIGLIDEIGMMEEIVKGQWSDLKIVDFSKVSPIEQLS